MSKSTKPVNRYWGSKSLPKSKSEFFDAVTAPAPSGTGTVATIRLYGPIDSWGGFWGISTNDVGAVLDALPDSVTQIILRINSPGGEVFEGVSILNMLRAHKASVSAVVDGLAASAASVIAAGADELVMSPGTQLMIHSPSSIVWGNAAEMRKTASVLDSIEASLIEIYTDKAGEKDWTALLADETWLTAAESVEMGLADRVAVIPDVGETETVGAEDEEIVTVPLEEDDPAEDFAARLRMSRTPDRAAAVLSHRPPSSSEPGDTNQKEDILSYDNLKAGLRERLGVTDAAVSDEQLFAALDETLREQAEPTATVPEGTVLMDAAALADLQASAAAGRDARNELDTTRRVATVNAALADGRITAASRDGWLASLERDEESTTGLLNSLSKNTVPVAEIGIGIEMTEADSLAEAAWGDNTTKGA